MRIEHVAIWVRDIETEKAFYTRYFRGRAGDKYFNSEKGFSSYFISFEEGARLELMHDARISAETTEKLGYAHIAFEFKNERAVDGLTQLLKESGFTVISNPRTTGDGYYESCVLDPEGNRVEITCGRV